MFVRSKFSANSCWYRATGVPNSLLQLTWNTVGMVWSMIFQLSDIKVVFSNPQYGKRDRKLTNEKFLNGKTFQINLKRNDNQSRSILFRFLRICNVLWDRLMANISRMFRFITFHYSNCCICIGNSLICSDIWHKYQEWYFEIVIRNFTSR